MKIPKHKKPSKTQELSYELKVEQVMCKDVTTLGPDSTMKDVRMILRNNKISGIPVVDDDVLLGIITIEDLIISLLEDGRIDENIKNRMTKDVIAVYPDEPIVQVVSKFVKSGYGRFPVVDRDRKKLIGIITKGDIIGGLLKKLENDYHQEEICRDRASHIFEDVISDDSTLILKYQIKGGEFKTAGEQTSKLRKSLLRLGFLPETIRRVVIATFEAEMNMVIFTPGGEIVAKIQPGNIIINAIDSGPGIPDVKKAMRKGYSTAPDWVREMGFGAGMGLPNINNYSDKMTLESQVNKGTNLNFVIHTNKK
ncbi:MAG: CBS domain-containing protein [Thermodesulfovibrionia bacterium]|nr:CBS domain-containing protein [Thermodesulfovibrionia bacterium]